MREENEIGKLYSKVIWDNKIGKQIGKQYMKIRQEKRQENKIVQESKRIRWKNKIGNWEIRQVGKIRKQDRKIG